MEKRFNITGVCIEERHYMMDTRQKIKAILEMVECGEYFTINRPRQYGKTTMLFLLEKHLADKEEYLVIKTSFEDIGDLVFEGELTFCRTLVELLSEAIIRKEEALSIVLEQKKAGVHNFKDLSKVFTSLVRQSGKKIILIIDEVDKSSNSQLFLSFLGLLRGKYLKTLEGVDMTFHSVILAGVHDIKTLKLKLRADDQGQYNSPWNIATDFEVEMRFNPKEIAPMLEDYSQAEEVKMDVPAISERLYYYTSGYPFLVSKLCKIIAEKLIPAKEKKAWSLEDVEAAVNLLLNESNTNFDSLIKNLENNEDLYDLAYEIIINGVEVPFNPHEPISSLGRLYGVFKQNGRLKIHNRVYEQILYEYMTAKTFRAFLKNRRYDFPTSFAKQDNTLDVEGVLLKFQQFMKEQYSEKDQKFLEREWRLIFLAFLKPIINGKGHDFKETQISDEKRLDIVVTYFQHKYIIELKRWYGDQKHEAGLDQLCDYLSLQYQQKGYLLIFEHQTKKTWRKEVIRQDDKTVFAVWV